MIQLCICPLRWSLEPYWMETLVRFCCAMDSGFSSHRKCAASNFRLQQHSVFWGQSCHDVYPGILQSTWSNSPCSCPARIQSTNCAHTLNPQFSTDILWLKVAYSWSIDGFFLANNIGQQDAAHPRNDQLVVDKIHLPLRHLAFIFKPRATLVFVVVTRSMSGFRIWARLSASYRIAISKYVWSGTSLAAG